MHCIGFFIPTISGYATDINYLDIFQFHALTVTVTNARGHVAAVFLRDILLSHHF